MSTTAAAHDLASRWKELLSSEPKLRIRDAANRLGVSEAELLATRVGTGVTRLEGDWRELVKAFPRLGEIMCLTRNDFAVHERYGKFEEVSFFGGPQGMGQVVGADIDLRLFMSHWVFGFAVEEEAHGETRRSFQFFDATGTAIHKVYLQESSDLEVHAELLANWKAADQQAPITTTPAAPAAAEKPDADVDVEAFRKEWLELKDTHQFFLLQRKHGLSREQALRLAPEGYAWKLDLKATHQMLEGASAQQLPIMVFIGSTGCIQIHTGPVKNIKWFGENWLNILDPAFNMHLRNDQVATIWAVRKPVNEGGVVTSLELFGANGENIALFFGARKPGQVEDPAWQALVASLPALEA